MQEIYKGFLIYDKRYYIELSEIDCSKQYNFKDGYLIEVKLNNRTVYKMNEYYSNKTVFDAIDIYVNYKDKEILKEPSFYIFDFWFNKLKRDATTFKKTFGLDKIDKRFINLKDCIEYWKGISLKDEKIKSFLTDEKIKSFFNIQIENDMIKLAKSKRLEYLV